MPPGIPLPFIRRDASWAPGSVGEARRGLLTGHVRGHLIELTDRIVLTLPEGDADLLAHRDWIAREVLADEIDLRADLKEPAIVNAEPAHSQP